MLTQRHVLLLDSGDSTVLECSFKSARYNMFDYPVIWRKQQLTEWTQVNVMGSVNEPFVSGSNRFELSFTATPPYYLIQLSIQGLCSPAYCLWLFALNRLLERRLGLRASGNLPVSYVLTGNLPESYHIVYFLVISKYIGGDTGAKPYN